MSQDSGRGTHVRVVLNAASGVVPFVSRQSFGTRSEGAVQLIFERPLIVSWAVLMSASMALLSKSVAKKLCRLEVDGLSTDIMPLMAGLMLGLGLGLVD